MGRFKISLSAFLAITTCLILLAIAIYERNRANDIESKSVVTTSPEYRAIIDQDWELMKREIQLEFAERELAKKSKSTAQTKKPKLAGMANYRRELANIRNSKLKLSREKSKLEDMRSDIIQSAIDASQR